MIDLENPGPLEIKYFFNRVAQIDHYPYGEVTVVVGSIDPTLRHFAMTVDVPLRDVWTQPMGDIRDYCLAVAKRIFADKANLRELYPPE